MRPVLPQTDPASAILVVLASLPLGDPGRPALRVRAIEAWLPLPWRIGRRYRGRGVPDDDLTQIATIGLIQAVDKFDPGYGTEFAAYAIPTITGEIKRYFRDRTWMVRVPRRLQERRIEVTAATAELTQILRRTPSTADVAVHLGITEDDVLDGLAGARAYGMISLSAKVDSDGRYELGDTLGEEEDGYALTDIKLALAPAIARLDEREIKILTLRFYGNLTQLEIARRIGVSQMHISRLIAQSLTKLRHELADDR